MADTVELSAALRPADRAKRGYRFRHGWIPIDSNGNDITDPSKLDAKHAPCWRYSPAEAN